ncbi:hypothetical protein COU61_02040 [Candidatus Pacearchaeota archaeon CG10_big_fil_rev_8_21_14_0_10_35_13]|nr:MAG: hypothetical protein COU61_02040 [Candidatus Pacearchaeota archaeon CG10_big_fil_rev_8_21_14_0_10_35_13]
MPFIEKLVMKGFKSFSSESTIPFSNGMNAVVGPNGSGKSSHYDTLVTLDNGREIKLGKLVEDQLKRTKTHKKLDDGIYADGTLKEPITILSLNKRTMKAEPKIVTKFIKREGEELYKLRTVSGKEVKATGCHPVMSFKEGEVRSLLISELKQGDLIASPRIIKTKGNIGINHEIFRIMGYLIGDGYIARDRIEFVNQDKEVLGDFRKLMSEHYTKDLKIRREKSVERIYLRDVKTVKTIRDYFIKDYDKSITSKVKKIPEDLLEGNNQCVANLLAGLYDTDGSVRKNIPVIEYCTKNKELANQVQGLLLRFGIMSKIKKRMCVATNTTEKIKGEYYYIYIYGKENLEKFYDNIKLRIMRKREIIKHHLDKRTTPNPNTDILPAETNDYVKEIASLLGIKAKPLRKDYPLLSAYIEKRCLPTRSGILRLLQIFKKKLLSLKENYNSLSMNQLPLVECMDNLNLSGQSTSLNLGLSRGTIRDRWATNKFNPKPENLQKFHDYIKNIFEYRLAKIKTLMTLLNNLANSDIYWDKIISIEKLPKEEWVYDLTIENNHNFIANNIFVHNSNITDAVCFVLGRLSIKSLRVAKAANLIFAGTKEHKPFSEATVKIVFNNEDGGLSINTKSVEIQRTVRRTGQSIYKINKETKTRGEVLELLTQAGIDPYGFNIVLQGEIMDLVKIGPEDRRKVIEEVAGISVYETRKNRSLKELEKTEEKLKEINAILRERTAYMKNLEQERQQALKYQRHEQNVKKYKASIIERQRGEKTKELERINQEIEKNNTTKEKLKEKLTKLREELIIREKETNEINDYTQKSSGIEMESLHEAITNLRAELAGLEVKKDNNEHRLEEMLRRRENLKTNIKNYEEEITMLKKKSPIMEQKIKELEKKKKELEAVEEKRKSYYGMKTELNSIRTRTQDKLGQLQRVKGETEYTIKEIERLAEGLTSKETESCRKEIQKIKDENVKLIEETEEKEQVRREIERTLTIYDREINENKDIKKQVSEIDTCPLCKNKMTEKHLEEVYNECDNKINNSEKSLTESEDKLQKIKGETTKIREKLLYNNELLEKKNQELVRLNSINEKKEYIKKYYVQEKTLEEEIETLEKKKKTLENENNNNKEVEELYDKLLMEIEDISSRTENNIDTELKFKQRDLDQTRNIIKQTFRDEEELSTEIEELKNNYDNKNKELKKKETQEQELQKKYQKLFEKRAKLQKESYEISNQTIGLEHEIRNNDDKINNQKIEWARTDAEIQNLNVEISEYEGIEIINMPVDKLRAKLQETQEMLIRIGNVNMRALEVYEGAREEYEKVSIKAETLNNEKEEIMKVIEVIDKKKKRTFMKTMDSVNELFTRNFLQLSTKGQAFLDLENKEDPFAGGLNIIIRVARGKYFDVSSLSGGEKTLVALSLIFAIQEYKPYPFYIFDEVDAALDKRNSEKLASLIKKHMKTGQYIVVTHNDALITESTILYGISMQDGISKVLSLRI